NWFTRWSKRPWFGSYDVYLCSSERSVEYMRDSAGKEAYCLRIATDSARFSPGPADSRFECDYCFVGGYFGANRDIETQLKPADAGGRFRLYGSGWEDHVEFEPYYFGPIEYGELVNLYRSTKIVLDDANHVTKPWASVNSRVFDALAAGCLVITNG